MGGVDPVPGQLQGSLQVKVFHRKCPSRNFHDRRVRPGGAGKVLCKHQRIQRRAHKDQAKLGPLFYQPPKDDEQEIGGQVSLVNLIDEDVRHALK